MTNTKRNENINLFYVNSVRHHAIVLAHDKNEAIKLSNEANKGLADPRVLFGSVGEWENWSGINASELKLSNGYRIVKEN